MLGKQEGGFCGQKSLVCDRKYPIFDRKAPENQYFDQFCKVFEQKCKVHFKKKVYLCTQIRTPFRHIHEQNPNDEPRTKPARQRRCADSHAPIGRTTECLAAAHRQASGLPHGLRRATQPYDRPADATVLLACEHIIYIYKQPSNGITE